jgi:Cytochrome c7 and related cytochrome c
MRKLAFFGAGSLLLALGAIAVTQRNSPAQQTAPAKPDTLAAWVLAKGDSSYLKGPRQPVFFRHDIHSGTNQIPCQYCHYSVSTSSEPGIPSMQSCMGCHLIIGGSDSSHKVEIKKLRDSWNNKQPIEWVRVYTLARHAHYSHARHIKALGANACQTCHGDVARMPRIFMVNNINNMGFCITCHVDRKIIRDCTTCHY